MLVPSGDILYFAGDAIANKSSFFNGSYNTLELDFDPLVNGYSFFKWMALPKWINDTFPDFRNMTEKNFLSGFSLSDIELENTSITHGFAANEYNIATNIKKGNTDFSITHREFSGSPIRTMYSFWVSGIRDPETGIATYPRLFKTDYAAKNHTGEIIYIVTRPDANNIEREVIEYACYYTAVFPKKIQLSQFAFTHGEHSATEYEQTFNAVFHQSHKVDELAKEVLKEKVYGFMEMNEFDPTAPDNGKSNNAADFFDEAALKDKPDLQELETQRETDTARDVNSAVSPDSAF